MKTIQHALEPGGALAAGDAPAAAFVRVELHNAQRELHHAGVFVQNDGAARAQHAFDFCQRVEIHRDVALFRFEERTRRASRYHRLQFLAIAHAAADFVDHPQQVESDRQLVHAGFVDVTGKADHARTAVLGRSQRRKRRPAIADDSRNRGKRLHVIQERRRLPGTHHCRKRRLHARDAALAFNGIEQGCFFTAFVSARAGVRVHVEIETSALDVFAQIAAIVGLGDGSVHGFD